MSQQTQPSRGQQIKMFVSIGKQLAASYIGWTIVISLLIGLAIGWFLFGWVIAPVQWTDAKPASLSWESGYQQRYLSYSADALTAGAPISEVAKNFGEGWNKAQVIEKLSQMINEGWPNADRLTRLRDELALFSGEVGPTETVTPSGVSSALVPLLLLLFFLALIGVGLVVINRLRRDQARPGAEGGARPISATITPTDTDVLVPEISRAAGGARPVEKTKWAGEQNAPLAQYATTYALGDDRYDMSFSIETAGGDFLGECGVGISETIGTGSPDKVTALEVWLFDKNDIRTVTKVLMSEHAFNDAAIRAKLAPKGDAYLARPGEVVTLQTQTLKVNARIDNLVYGTGSLPPNSFFEKVDLELAAWSLG